jgi:hypothetical protein
MAANAKAVIAAAGGVVSVLAAGTALFVYAPASIAGPGTAVLAVIEIIRTLNVWLVRNEPAIENAVTAAGELVDDIREGLHQAAPIAVQPVPPPAPGVSEGS